MPMIDLFANNIETSPMDLGVYRNEDEMYFKRLSVYATLRPHDLKRQDSERRTDGHVSLKDLLKEWTTRSQVDEEKQTIEPEADKLCLELRDHELLVKGFEVDNGIAPGFRYSVRYIGRDEYLFNGEARTLVSVGLGYGQRLTFKGDRLNFNDCYFWSDSAPEGFAFNIEAVTDGDEFTIIDSESQPIAKAEVQNVEFPQIEKDTFIEGSSVVKHVQVRFTCSIKHLNRHSLFNVSSKSFDVVEGVAELVKKKGSKEAVVRVVKDVFFQNLGRCSLIVE